MSVSLYNQETNRIVRYLSDCGHRTQDKQGASEHLGQGVQVTRTSPSIRTRCPVNKVNKDKYRYKDKSPKYKDQKDKVSILQGQDKTWSVPEPWTLVRRKVHSYLPW